MSISNSLYNYSFLNVICNEGIDKIMNGVLNELGNEKGRKKMMDASIKK